MLNSESNLQLSFLHRPLFRQTFNRSVSSNLSLCLKLGKCIVMGSDYSDCNWCLCGTVYGGKNSSELCSTGNSLHLILLWTVATLRHLQSFLHCGLNIRKGIWLVIVLLPQYTYFPSRVLGHCGSGQSSPSPLSLYFLISPPSTLSFSIFYFSLFSFLTRFICFLAIQSLPILPVTG